MSGNIFTHSEVHFQSLASSRVHWVALCKLKIFCTRSQALMPRCPTFRDGLNLCPQMRQINPDSADIISRSSLWHRRNSRHRSTAAGSPFIPVPPDSDSDWQPKEETQTVGPQIFLLADVPVAPGRGGARSKSRTAEYVWVCFRYARRPFDLKAP